MLIYNNVSGEPGAGNATRRHPAWGALKGTFTVEPDWDLARPALDPEDLAGWEADLETKAGLIEAGLQKSKP